MLRIGLLQPLVLLLLPVGAFAQFFLNGNAIQTNSDCYQLTDAVNWQLGSIWNPNKIDLSQSFDLVMEVNLGCVDGNGADGMVFGLQPVSTSIGQAGGGIGFEGVQPSLGIEIDTWQNGIYNDPADDHLAIIRNGNLNHATASTLAGPTRASPTSGNIEDCEWHDMRVSWDAPSQSMLVYFDCSLRLMYSGDIVNEIFGGDPLVFWGFTSATGGANNKHQVCFTYTTFLDALPDFVMCPGGQVTLEATGGTSYLWTPVTGLDDPTAAQPVASPAETTTYRVEIYDSCDYPFYDEVTVTVAGDSVFFDLGPDTTLCEGETLQLDVTTPTATYQWQDATSQPTYQVTDAGRYAVTVTRTDTFCTAEDWVEVNYLPLPIVDLGPDTTLCQEQEITLHAAFPDATVMWSDGSSLDSLRVTTAGTYTALLEHHCGSISDQVLIAYEDCRELYLPNAFSPNQDGVNDRFYPQDGGDVQTIHQFQIFDRWGGQVFVAEDFQPNDSALGWDGRHRGRQATAGTYAWYIDIEFRDGYRERRSGAVYLLR